MIEWQESLIRLSLAALFGAIIGLERERKNWAAGMRTHMMVCVGASLTMLVSTYGFSEVVGKSGYDLDPSRIAAQVISGIGFIGAGTIMFLRKGVVRGLTTAAGLWTVAAIGLATGSGMYFAALSTTILAIIILLILQPIEKKFANQFKISKLNIKIANKEKVVPILEAILDKEKYGITNFNLHSLEEHISIDILFDHSSKTTIPQLIKQLDKSCEIQEIKWNE